MRSFIIVAAFAVLRYRKTERRLLGYLLHRAEAFLGPKMGPEMGTKTGLEAMTTIAHPERGQNRDPPKTKKGPVNHPKPSRF